ncbi:MAG: PAS domain S-box protein [Desulfovibrionaceae bacterium]
MGYFARTGASLLLILLAGLCVLGTAHAEASPQTLRVGVYQNPPLLFTNDHGEPSGLFADVLKDIAASEGWSLDFVSGSWEAVYHGAVNAEIDILPATAILESREKKLDFSETPLIINWARVYTPKGKPMASFPEFEGKRIGLLKQDTHAQAFKELMKKFNLSYVPVEYDNYLDLFKDLSAEQLDAGVVNRMFGERLQHEFPVQKSPTIFNPIPVGFAVAKQDPKNLLPVLNARIAKLLTDKSSSYYTSMNRWFDRTQPSRSKLQHILIAVLLLAMLLLAATLALQTVVKRKTRELQLANETLKREIQERKHAEKVAKNQETRYRLLAKSSADLIWTMDENRRYTYFNPAAESMLGYTPEELLNLPQEKRFPPSSLEKIRQADAIRFAHWQKKPDEIPAMTMELQQIRKDGTVIWTEVVSTPILDDDGAPCGVLGVTREITDRKKIERELLESERRFREMIVKSPHPMCILDSRAETILLCNDAFTNAFGYTTKDVAAGGDWWSAFCPEPAQRETIKTAWRNAVSPGWNSQKGHPPRVWMIRRKDGQFRKVETHLTPLGKEWLISMFDLTSHLELQAELVQAKEEAETANKAKTEFLANMSHEIRTPLNGALGMLQLMATTELNAEQCEYIDAAITSCQRLTRLMGDILDLSRVEAGKLDLFEEPFDLSDTLHSILQLFQPMAEEKGLAIKSVIDPRVPWILAGDAGRLQQVLNNLLGNALKFTEKGRVSMEATLLPNASDGEVFILFTIADTGAGVPDDRLNDIFSPFTQVDGSFTRSYQGAGLGLAICKRIVELMGGAMSVESEYGRGTTFYVSIPFKVGDAPTAPAPEAEPPPIQSGFHVLLAEDDPVNQKTVGKMLEKLGCRVVPAEDGRHALELLKKDRFDLVFMDIQMPVLDGVQATMAIRSKAAGSHNAYIPIVALTAYAMPGDRNRFLEAGMDAYLAKPVDFDDLRDVLAKFFHKTGNPIETNCNAAT